MEILDKEPGSNDETIVYTNKTFIPILTQFEITSLIGVRTTQIDNGSMPCIDYSINDTPKQIAIRELKEKKMPFKIKRKLNNYVEIWTLDELELNTDLLPSI